jgi:chemotaxis protein methyltransferase CheR
MAGTNWKLSVSDNGIGRPDGAIAQPKPGLGTSIITALVQQLGAKLETSDGQKGMTVSVTHATFMAT